MKPDYWGPFIWSLIHNIAYKIPSDKYFVIYKQFYINFYYSLKNIIPCPICRNHYNTLINNNNPVKCNNKQSIIQWTIDIHNKVNNKLSKKNVLLDDALKVKYNSSDLIKGIDIIAFNVRHNTSINYYGVFFDSLRVVFPILPIRIALTNAMKLINIRVKNHNDLHHWYRSLGYFIAKSLKSI